MALGKLTRGLVRVDLRAWCVIASAREEGGGKDE